MKFICLYRASLQPLITNYDRLAAAARFTCKEHGIQYIHLLIYVPSYAPGKLFPISIHCDSLGFLYSLKNRFTIQVVLARIDIERIHNFIL